jgi:hypothetical protein
MRWARTVLYRSGHRPIKRGGSRGKARSCAHPFRDSTSTTGALTALEMPAALRRRTPIRPAWPAMSGNQAAQPQRKRVSPPNCWRAVSKPSSSSTGIPGLLSKCPVGDRASRKRGIGDASGCEKRLVVNCEPFHICTPRRGYPELLDPTARRHGRDPLHPHRGHARRGRRSW